MAYSETFFVASITPITPNKISKIGDATYLDLKTKSTSEKWSIKEDYHVLLSTTLKYNTKNTTLQLQDELRIEHSVRVNQFKRMLTEIGEKDPLESLNLIDAIQRLCIDHHFQEEIESILRRHYVISRTHTDGNGTPHDVALRFRLMRQQGYFIPSDIFGNFMDSEGKFNKLLSKDIKGMMSLYEASQLRIHEEDILDEAEYFCAQFLKDSIRYLDPHQAKVVNNTLANPHHKSLVNLTVQNYFGDLICTNRWMSVLQQLAKTDFSIVQTLYQMELTEFLRWWEKMGLAKKLKFARDQPLKWYICSLAFLGDPNMSYQRIELTKFITFIYLIDDIFDVYGTLHELTLFTEAVNRWDVEATEQLPECMKICFKVLYDITNEISDVIYQKHGWNPIDTLRKTWGNLCKAFLVEAEWFASGQIPSAEKYLSNGVVSSGVHVVLVYAFFLIGEGINNETVEVLESKQRIISSSATILRLWDDLGSAKDENQDGTDGSYISCYMKENTGTSIEATRNHIFSMISDEWKNLNQECLSPNPFPTSFAATGLNIGRMVPLLYSYDENQGLPNLEKLVKSLLYESVY